MRDSRRSICNATWFENRVRRDGRRCRICGSAAGDESQGQPATIRITFKVTTCTDYVDDREPSYHELIEKAWILRPASKRRAAGFVRAADLRGAKAAHIFDDPTDPD